MKVVQIGAAWCAGCIVMKPIWRDVVAVYPELETTYYDVDDDEEMIQKYGDVKKLPLFIFFDAQGQEIERLRGEIPRNDLLKKIEILKNI